jgi:hypothetical protein
VTAIRSGDDGVRLWRTLLDDGGSVAVYLAGRHFRVRVELPHPDYLGPDVVGERVLTRERFRQLWLAVNWRRPYGHPR